MKICIDKTSHGSILIIVLWISFGLVALTIYFANSMSLELRASSNRVSATTADQAIEGAARYISQLLANQISLGSNGMVPDATTYTCQAVPVGDAHFWIIGRDANGQATRGQVVFGLVDEASKLNLNTAPSSQLELLPRMTTDLASAIVDWRDADDTVSANGAEAQTYALQHPPYLCKNANFETTGELRLVLGANMDILAGEDLNRNGALDPNETDDGNGVLDSGVLDYVTVYSREPNTGRALISNQGQISSLLQNTFGLARANQILARPGLLNSISPLQFYIVSGMSADEFARIETNLTTTAASNIYIEGRVNVSTASASVLACIPGLTNYAQDLVSYRLSNPDKLASIAWVTSVIGKGGAAILAGPFITAQSYQFTADIAALGQFGRGYRRVKYVFDTSDGAPKIIFRQDLAHLGWALGKDARQTWFMADYSK